MSEFLTLKDHVYHYISEQIASGKLASNEKINENEIVQKLNISRTPVREALIQLASEGLLENVPRKGFLLNQVGEKTAIELYALIGLLEGHAAKQVAAQITEKDLKLMEFYVSSMDLAVDANNYEMYYELQAKFHDVYLNLCDNQTLKDALVQFKKKFVRKFYLGEHTTPEVLKATNQEHRDIIDLFRQKKYEELETLIRSHWNETYAYMESL